MSDTGTATLNVTRLAGVCGQFGSDLPHIRTSAARSALRMLKAADLGWADVTSRRAAGLDAILSGIASDAPESRVADATAQAHQLVLATVKSWDCAITGGRGEQGGGMSAEEFAAYMHTMWAGFQNGGFGGYGSWEKPQPRRPRPQRNPDEPMHRRISRNIPCVVIGRIDLLRQFEDARGRMTFEFNVFDLDNDIEYGPIVARDTKTRMRLIAGIGKKMRLTLRAGTLPRESPEAIRTVPAD